MINLDLEVVMVRSNRSREEVGYPCVGAAWGEISEVDHEKGTKRRHSGAP